MKKLKMKIQKLLIAIRLTNIENLKISEMTSNLGVKREKLLEKKMQIGLQIQSINNAKLSK